MTSKTRIKRSPLESPGLGWVAILCYRAKLPLWKPKNMFVFFPTCHIIFSYWQVCDNFFHSKKHQQLGGFTLPESNIAPENGWLEDEFPFGMNSFQVFMLVSGRFYLFIKFSWWAFFFAKLFFLFRVSFRHSVVLIHDRTSMFGSVSWGSHNPKPNHPVTTPAFLGLDVLCFFWGVLGSQFPAEPKYCSMW